MAERLGVAAYVAEPGEGGLLYAGAALRALFGLPAGPDTSPDPLIRTLHPDDRPILEEARRRQAAGERTEVAYRVVLPDGSLRWIRDVAAPVPGADGGSARVVGVVEDVTSLRRREETASFLAEAALLLGSSLEPEEVLARVARLAVPRMADWCRIHVVGPDGVLEAGEPAHRDPAQLELLREMERRFPPRPALDGGVDRVVRTGRAELYPDISDAMLEAAAQGPEHLDLVRRLGLRSAMIVPLRARDRVLGALSFARAESPHRYDEEDVAAAADLAERAALALENARLHRETRAARQRAEVEHARALELLEGVPDGFLTVDRAWRITFVNAAARERLRGRVAEGRPQGEVLWSVLPDMVGTTFETVARRVMERREPDRVEAFHPALDRWYLSRLYPISEGVAVVFQEVTARRREEASRKLLDDASVLLASSVDYGATLRGVARLAVPQFADLALVYLLEGDEGLEPVAHAAADPDLEAALDAFLAAYRPSDNPGSPSLQVMASGEPLLVRELTAQHLETWSLGRPELRDTARRLRGGSYLTVPLTARTRPLGVIVFARVAGGAPFGQDDVALAGELARRGAAAVDNARLLRRTEEARREAERASRAKSQFLAVMSHELRTPLNAIVGYGDLLEGEVSGPINEKQRRHLGRIRESAWHLLSLIDEILSLSRIEAGREDVTLAEVDAVEMAEDAAAFVEPQAERKGLAMRVERPPDPVTMESDPGKVRQILLNVLANAVKFTRRGSVTLRLEVNDAEVLFHVADTGPGIASAEREAIFEPFTRGSGQGAEDEGGTGLGLAVSRRFARILGGDLTLESEPGRGSVFTLRLPRRPPEDLTAAARGVHAQ